MFFLLFVEFISFPSRTDAILGQNSRDVMVESSGSLGFYKENKCQQSYPNQTLNSDEKQDWCSNLAKSNAEEEKPWILYSLQGKTMKIKGYSLRSGCCIQGRCCCINGDSALDVKCCCWMYSFSLQGSNNNITWKTVHKVEKDSEFYRCMTKTYDFPETETFRFIRLLMDQEYPSCAFCMAINQIELYGSTINEMFAPNNDFENDESVSIIGKIKRGDSI